MAGAGTWAPYMGTDSILLAALLLLIAAGFAYLGLRLRSSMTPTRPGRTVRVFLILIWVLSLLGFLNDSFVAYGLALVQANLLTVYESYTAPNPVTPITYASGAVTFIVILLLTRRHGSKVALLSAFVGTLSGPMIFELPFDLIVLNRIYPPIPPSPITFRLLFFLPLFLVEISTMSFLTFSPLTKLSKYTLFSLAGLFFVFAVWAAFGFSYPSPTHPLETALNAISKVMSFITAITLFVDIGEGGRRHGGVENLTKQQGSAIDVIDQMSGQVSDSIERSQTASDVITVQHLVKRYGKLAAVDDISFSIRKGEIFGIIGPNGAGKTTTVECISGIRVPDSGSISIFGLSPQKDRNEIRKIVGVQLQESALPPRIKVGEAVDLFASFYSNPLNSDDLLKSLGIEKIKNTFFKKLSGGQKQRLSIALALVGNPRVAILDELTTGLDPEARRETWDLIEGIRERGVTVILVTHFMDEAERLCDRLALINHGIIRALDTPEAIAAQAGGNRVRFVPSQPVDDKTLYAIPGVSEVERKGRYITVTGRGDLAAAVIESLAKIGVQASDIEARAGNLDDAFVKLTKDDTSRTPGGVQS